MKYNKTEIMKKANALRANYNMNKSEALTKAWGIAKYGILKNELAELNMYSQTGGRNNIFAQSEIRNHEEKVSAVRAKIENLKNAIYPTVKTEIKVKLTNPTVQVTFNKDTGKYVETIIEYLTQTSEYLDINAYNLVA